MNINNAKLILKEKGLNKFLIASYFRTLIALNSIVPFKRYIKRSIFDYKMYLDVKDAGISRSLLLHAERELDHKKMLEEIVKPGMTIFDIGANIGYYVLMERNLLKGRGNVIAIEPSPWNTDLLKRNLLLNGVTDVPVYTMAISNKIDKKPFFIAKQTNLNTFHATGSGKANLSGKVIDVDTHTVQSFSKMIGVIPDLIRMDVEGHEVEVIEGMLDAILRGEMRPAIIFETHLTRYNHDHDFSHVLKKLFDLGYKAKIVSSSSMRGTRIINSLGYKSYQEVASDDVLRSLYRDISYKDTISLICKTGGIRTAYFAIED